jgi:predicted nuclease of restriction endonuclease-like (RecB) superfamily
MKKPLKKSVVSYLAVLENIKKTIKESRYKAALSVNSEMIKLYWKIGDEILQRQRKSKWGDKVLEKLSEDLLEAFPDMKGFSKRNIFYMRKFAEIYPDFLFVQQAAAQIPWFHNVAIMQSISEHSERLFYIKETVANGWSRNHLEMQIKTELFHRQGKAITNFKNTLPATTSDLLNQTLKDPYIFDFLTIAKDATEREIEKSLIQQVEKLLLTLGRGFAFVGRQYELNVDEESYFIDLLFYHIPLKSYVVIELKVGKFKPNHTGMLNFYLSAVDAQLKNEDDNPSIGILLCNDKGALTAEYALQGINKPIGVSSYKITEKLPRNLKSQLPTIEELEASLSIAQNEPRKTKKLQKKSKQKRKVKRKK